MGIFEAFKNPFKSNPEKTELFGSAETMLAGDKIETALQEEVSGVRKKPRSPEQEKYSLEKTGHELALRYDPEFLGQGGDNIVYDVPSRPDVVVKGSKFGLYEILSQDMFSPETENAKENHTLREAQKRLEKERAMYRKLVKYFGKEHVLPQKKFLMKVPVTKEILEESEKTFQKVLGGSIPKDVEEAWTYVTIQRRQEIPEEHLTSHVGSMEVSLVKNRLLKDRSVMERYERVTEAMLRGNDDASMTPQEIVSSFNTQGMYDLAVEMEFDADLKETVKEFAEHAIDFAEESGEILDLAGKDNVIFFREGEKWTYKLLDPLYSFDDQLMEKSRKAYLDPNGAQKNWNALFQGVNFVRGINALAKLSGSDRRLEYLPKDLMKKSIREKLLGALEGRT